MNRNSIKRSRLWMLLLLAVSLSFLGCALFQRQVVVVPGDREVVEAPGKPGYYLISAGMLKELYDLERICVAELEACQLKCDK